MAQRTVVELTDDLRGGPATRTIEFGLDGKSYVIDLSDANAERFLAPWRRTSRARKRQ
jgi:hypothetical protein